MDKEGSGEGNILILIDRMNIRLHEREIRRYANRIIRFAKVVSDIIMSAKIKLFALFFIF